MKLKEVFIMVCERGLGIIAYIFPFVEISSYFGAKVSCPYRMNNLLVAIPWLPLRETALVFPCRETVEERT